MWFFIGVIAVVIVISVLGKSNDPKTPNVSNHKTPTDRKEVTDIYEKDTKTLRDVTLSAYDGTYAVFKDGNKTYTLKVEDMPMTDEASRIHEQKKFRVYYQKKKGVQPSGKTEGLLIKFIEID